MEMVEKTKHQAYPLSKDFKEQVISGEDLKVEMSSFLIFGLIKRPEWRYCIGQKVCSHFSIPSCEKTCTNLLANPVFLSQYSMFPISACFPTTSLTNEPSATVFKTSHFLSNLGCYFEFLYIYIIYILIYIYEFYIYKAALKISALKI